MICAGQEQGLVSGVFTLNDTAKQLLANNKSENKHKLSTANMHVGPTRCTHACASPSHLWAWEVLSKHLQYETSKNLFLPYRGIIAWQLIQQAYSHPLSTYCKSSSINSELSLYMTHMLKLLHPVQSYQRNNDLADLGRASIEMLRVVATQLTLQLLTTLK